MAEEERTRENYAAARKLWETFLNKYPLDGRAPQILLAFGQMEFDEAARLAAGKVKADAPAAEGAEKAKPDPEGAAKIFAAAIDDWQRLVSKYPGTNEASQGALNIGITLEVRLNKLADALEAYKKVEGRSREKRRNGSPTSPRSSSKSSPSASSAATKNRGSSSRRATSKACRSNCTGSIWPTISAKCIWRPVSNRSTSP